MRLLFELALGLRLLPFFLLGSPLRLRLLLLPPLALFLGGPSLRLRFFPLAALPFLFGGPPFRLRLFLLAALALFLGGPPFRLRLFLLAPQPLFLGGPSLRLRLFLLAPQPLFLGGPPPRVRLLLLAALAFFLGGPPLRPPLPAGLFAERARPCPPKRPSPALQWRHGYPVRVVGSPIERVALPADQVGGLDDAEPERGEDVIQTGGHQNAPIPTHRRLVLDPR